MPASTIETTCKQMRAWMTTCVAPDVAAICAEWALAVPDSGWAGLMRAAGRLHAQQKQAYDRMRPRVAPAPVVVADLF